MRPSRTALAIACTVSAALPLPARAQAPADGARLQALVDRVQAVRARIDALPAATAEAQLLGLLAAADSLERARGWAPELLMVRFQTLGPLVHRRVAQAREAPSCAAARSAYATAAEWQTQVAGWRFAPAWWITDFRRYAPAALAADSLMARWCRPSPPRAP